MKKILIKTFIKMAIFTYYTFRLSIIPVLLATSMVLAEGQSLSSVVVHIQKKESSVVEVLKLLDQKTRFHFMYSTSQIPARKQVRIRTGYRSVKEVLKSMARQAHLDFRRVGKQVFVRKSEYQDLALRPEPVIEESQADREISGKVSDAQTGEPLVGATIIVKGTTLGTTTNVEGNFTLSLPEEATILTFSYTGYVTKEINIGNQSSFNITLTVDIESLDEIVVVGYGTQEKINLTGSVTQVNGKAFSNRPITQSSQALQGLAPGVFINTNSGEPGNDQADITIRGIGTLNNSNPLILVDGIEAPINSVNPNDIESINVLKDAASASIYGTRAANGVILITTKQGKYNQKTTITYDGYVGISNPTVLPDMVWDNRTYLELYREAALNSGRNFGFDDEDIARYDNIPSTNWMEAMTRENVAITHHNLSFRGGTEKLNFYFSSGYLYQEGFLAGKNDYNRFSNRLNLNAKLTDKLTFGTSLSYFTEFGYLTPKDRLGRSFADKGSLVFSGAMIQHPVSPVFDELGRYGSIEAALGIERNRPSGQGVADNETIELRGNDLLGKIFLEYEPIKNLKIRGTLGINYQDESITDIKKEYVTYDPVTGEPWTNGNGTRNPGSRLNFIKQQSLNVTSWLQATYQVDFGNHSLGFLLGFNRETANLEMTDIDEREFGTRDVISVGQGSLVQTDGGVSEWALASFFGRVNYSYGDRYLVEFNLRRDGSSRFGANNRWATFPAVSAGWVVSNEEFWGENFVSFLKIRASWGKLGNQSNRLYPFASQVGLGEDYNGNPGAALSLLGNPDLQWEETTTTNLGFELRLFEGKLNLEADYFTKKTDDILTNLANPLTSGISSTTTVNAASMENKGFELMVNYRSSIKKVNFNIGFNLTHIKNEVTSINPDLTDDEDRIRVNLGDNVYIIRGQPIFAMFGHRVEGIFQSQDEIDSAPDHSFIGTPGPGDFRYTDLNGDGVINADDQTVIGNRQPEWLYGVNFSVDYKGFELSGLFQGIGNADVWIARMYGPFPFAGIRSYWRDNRWTPENPSETVPRLWVDRRGYNGASIGTSDKLNSFWVQNRAYLRLKNIRLAYTFPEKLLEKTPIRNLLVYLNAQNLWTSTDLEDIDPERFSQESHATNVLPQAKVISFGINATF